MSRIEEHLQHAEGGFQEQPLYDYLAEIQQEMSIIDSLSLVDADSSAIAHSRYFPVPRTYAGDRGCIRHVDAVPEEDLAGRDRLALLQGRDGLALGLSVTSDYS